MNKLHDLQTAALYRLFALGSVLGPALNEGLAEQGLTSARAELVWRLHRHGAMNQRQLSEMLQCTPRNITGLVDALEAADLVERRPHPTDRRAALVTLTEAGQQVARSWDQRSEQFAAELLDGISGADLEHLVASIDVVLHRLGASLETD